MKETLNFLRNTPPTYLAAGLVAVLIQIQITLGRNATSLGLTLNFADFVLPILGLLIVFSLYHRKSTWPRWRTRGVDLLIAALTVYFLFSAVYAYSLTGTLNSWALVNRLIGWGVLVAYFYAGAWTITNIGLSAIRPFILVAASFCLLTNGIDMVGITLNDLKIIPESIDAYPLNALMGNRNAAAFLFLANFAAIGLYHRNFPSRLTNILMIAFCFLSPAVLFLNGSRVMMVLLPAVLLYFAFLHRAHIVRSILIPLLIGIACFGVITSTTGRTLREDQTERINIAAIASTSTPKLHGSDSVRTIINTDAIELFHEHPAFGIGLGNFLHFQTQKYGHLIDLIDSVPLWFLTEMGIAGFSLFLFFGVRIFWPILRGVRGIPGPDTAFCQVAVAIILIFCVMALVHQLFYARFFWAILGLAAAVPLRPNHPSLSP